MAMGMLRRRVVALALVAVSAASAGGCGRGQPRDLPAQLSDREYWALVKALSEPAGGFQSDNLVSNEHTFQLVVPRLWESVPRGAVYLGVAPDQNFTYILAVRPRMAFIVDIRRGNLQMHVMYKALFELSADRADFLSRLFSRPRPDGLTPAASAEDLFLAYAHIEATDELYARNLEALKALVIERHAEGLTQGDLQGIEYIYEQFYWFGPGITYTSTQRRGGGGNFPSYAALMLQQDGQGRNQSYLASEDNFAFLKAFQHKNLLVPVVGDFGGPKALRAVGKYVRDRSAFISAFYVSNVEQYLFRDTEAWRAFYENVATLPLDSRSVFIRSVSRRDGYTGSPQGPDGRATVLDPMQMLVHDFSEGRIHTYRDVASRGY